MIDPPKRTGYRLTYNAQMYYDDWKEYGGCRCFQGNAPCGACTHEGHPISLEENDEAWELDHTIADVYNAWKLKQEMEMSRSCITDRGSGMQPPKPTSEWFGFKYRVTPESSKLLQEAVFKDGGKWISSGSKLFETKASFVFVGADGIMTLSSYFGDFQDHKLPEKKPPQPTKVAPLKKEFVVGKWYKCINHSCDVTENVWYRLVNFGMKEGSLRLTLEKRNGCGVMRDIYATLFDINSESDYDPNTAQPAGYTAYVVFKQDASGFGRNTYNGKEYAYKCSFEDLRQASELHDGVYAEVNVSGVEKKVKVLRIEAKVDPKATKSIVRVLPKELAKDVETSRIQTVVQVTINRDDFFTKETTNYPTTKEDVNMSNQNRVVSVKFFDDDAGLKAEHSLVAEYQVTTRVSDQMTISKVLLTEDVAGDIAAHNEVRAATVDLNILKNTGNNVFLMPVEFEDLRVEVRQV